MLYGRNAALKGAARLHGQQLTSLLPLDSKEVLKEVPNFQELFKNDFNK